MINKLIDWFKEGLEILFPPKVRVGTFADRDNRKFSFTEDLPDRIRFIVVVENSEAFFSDWIRGQTGPQRYEQIKYEGTFDEALEAARANRFVYWQTGHVYGPGYPTDENNRTVS